MTQVIPYALNSIPATPPPTYPTGFVGFDKLLGEGLVKGSASLLAGVPGAGKSTLLIQLAFNLATLDNLKILYVAGEENKEQIKMRAQRLGIDSGKILLFEDTEVENVLAEQKKLLPDLIIIDSLQMLYSKLLKTATGAPTQIRNGLLTLTKMAKDTQTTIIFIGHSTKGGYVGGLQSFQHLVDTVLYLGIDEETHERTIEAKKNRFGSIDFIWRLEMTQAGLIDPEHPTLFTTVNKSTTTGTSTQKQVNLSEYQVAAILENHRMWKPVVQASLWFLKRQVASQ
jgi:DNA repair protein RadA/Sms